MCYFLNIVIDSFKNNEPIIGSHKNRIFHEKYCFPKGEQSENSSVLHFCEPRWGAACEDSAGPSNLLLNPQKQRGGRKCLPHVES